MIKKKLNLSEYILQLASVRVFTFYTLPDFLDFSIDAHTAPVSKLKILSFNLLPMKGE